VALFSSEYWKQQLLPWTKAEKDIQQLGPKVVQALRKIKAFKATALTDFGPFEDFITGLCDELGYWQAKVGKRVLTHVYQELEEKTLDMARHLLQLAQDTGAAEEAGLVVPDILRKHKEVVSKVAAAIPTADSLVSLMRTLEQSLKSQDVSSKVAAMKAAVLRWDADDAESALALHEGWKTYKESLDSNNPELQEAAREAWARLIQVLANVDTHTELVEVIDRKALQAMQVLHDFQPREQQA